MSGLEDIPAVAIDPTGTFKYILIEVTGGRNKKIIVRGDAESEYHADIFEKCKHFMDENKFKVTLKCLGGGRIKHDQSKKHLLIYGHSVGFGRADHSVTSKLLKDHYKDYNIEWNNEGY